MPRPAPTFNSPPFTGLDIAPCRAAIRSVVEEATGIMIAQRKQIELFHGDTLIAKIEITDDSVWREFAHDLGFQA